MGRQPVCTFICVGQTVGYRVHHCRPPVVSTVPNLGDSELQASNAIRSADHCRLNHLLRWSATLLSACSLCTSQYLRFGTDLGLQAKARGHCTSAHILSRCCAFTSVVGCPV